MQIAHNPGYAMIGIDSCPVACLHRAVLVTTAVQALSPRFPVSHTGNISCPNSLHTFKLPIAARQFNVQQQAAEGRACTPGPQCIKYRQQIGHVYHHQTGVLMCLVLSSFNLMLFVKTNDICAQTFSASGNSVSYSINRESSSLSTCCFNF